METVYTDSDGAAIKDAQLLKRSKFRAFLLKLYYYNRFWCTFLRMDQDNVCRFFSSFFPPFTLLCEPAAVKTSPRKQILYLLAPLLLLRLRFSGACFAALC